jgi:hypothetical protein
MNQTLSKFNQYNAGKKPANSGNERDARSCGRANVTLTSVTWWDRVFDENYSLLPLDSLTDFLLKNKHLPDIPSQDEVLSNGLDIGEFNSLLLKKIEELYLYIIEQQKQIDILNNEIKK